MDWFESAAEYLREKLKTKKFVAGESFLREFLENETQVLDGFDDEEKDISINEWLELFEEYIRNHLVGQVNIGKNFRWMRAIDGTASSEPSSKMEAETPLKISLLEDIPLSDLSPDNIEHLVELVERSFQSGNYSDCINYGNNCLRKLNKELAPVDERLNVLNIMIGAALKSKRVDLYKFYARKAELLASVYEHEEAGKCFEEAVDELIQNYNKNVEYIANIKQKINDLFRKCRIQFENGFNNSSASRVFIKECRFNRSTEKKRLKKGIMTLFDLFSEYGESPSKVFWSGVAIIFVWAFIYFLTGINEPSGVLQLSCNQASSSLIIDCIEVSDDRVSKLTTWEYFASFFSYLYYSVVTFTTLGYGDFSPQEGPSRFFSAIEAVLGLLFTSLFLATFTKKYSR